LEPSGGLPLSLVFSPKSEPEEAGTEAKLAA